MSTRARNDLIEQLSGTVMRWQDATEKYDDAVGTLYGLNQAERHCLSLLWQGPLPPGVIAREIGLTPPSVTALVDRLEKRGFLTREPDPDDRRKMRIAMTEKTQKMSEEMYLPLAEKGRKLLAAYSDDHLAAIAKFAGEALAVQEAATAAILKRKPKA